MNAQFKSILTSYTETKFKPFNYTVHRIWLADGTHMLDQTVAKQYH